VLLLLDVWPLGRLVPSEAGWIVVARNLVIEKLPLLGMSLARIARSMAPPHRSSG